MKHIGSLTTLLPAWFSRRPWRRFGIAYAVASGLPGVYGLYATIVPLLAHALFGPSRILVLGPDPALAAVILGVTALLATEMSIAPSRLPEWWPSSPARFASLPASRVRSGCSVKDPAHVASATATIDNAVVMLRERIAKFESIEKMEAFIKRIDEDQKREKPAPTPRRPTQVDLAPGL
jgi:MFS superfamily sulfate permease-like transporter